MPSKPATAILAFPSRNCNSQLICWDSLRSCVSTISSNRDLNWKYLHRSPVNFTTSSGGRFVLVTIEFKLLVSLVKIRPDWSDRLLGECSGSKCTLDSSLSRFLFIFSSFYGSCMSPLGHLNIQKRQVLIQIWAVSSSHVSCLFWTTRSRLSHVKTKGYFRIF
jgi:hypothetical protein